MDDWSKFIDYRGYNKADQVISWFYQILRSCPAEQKLYLLQFTTHFKGAGQRFQWVDGLRRLFVIRDGDATKLSTGHAIGWILPPQDVITDLLRFVVESVSLIALNLHNGS